MKNYFTILLFFAFFLTSCGVISDKEESFAQKNEVSSLYEEKTELVTEESDFTSFEEYLAQLKEQNNQLLIEFQMAVENAEGFQEHLTQKDVESDTIQWFNTTYAPLTYANGEDITLIGGEPPTKYSLAAELLERDWGIYDRESADKVIQSVLTEGHRSHYMLLIMALKQDNALYLTEFELQNMFKENDIEEEDVYKILATYEAYHQYGEKGIDAWDYCRVIQLLGDCYVCGYYSLPETLNGSYVIAKHLQEEYSSWEELAGSYLKGYEFWTEDNPQDKTSKSFIRRNYYENLCKSENNPYLLEFNLTLTDNWSKESKN